MIYEFTIWIYYLRLHLANIFVFHIQTAAGPRLPRFVGRDRALQGSTGADESGLWPIDVWGYCR